MSAQEFSAKDFNETAQALLSIEQAARLGGAHIPEENKDALLYMPRL